MYRITKQFDFSASHSLEFLPREHKCHRLHGHNYTVIVTLESVFLNDQNFVEDYGELSDIKRYLDETLDHRHLNDILPVPPTAECLAKYLYEIFKEKHPLLKEVTVKETEKTSASYS